MAIKQTKHKRQRTQRHAPSSSDSLSLRENRRWGVMDGEGSRVGVAEMELMTEMTEKTAKQGGGERERQRWGDTQE